MHFVGRGGLLIGLQFLIENPLWSLKPGAAWLNYFGVLYALGASMILIAGLWKLPSWALLTFGSVMIVLQETLVRMLPQIGDDLPLGLALLLIPGKSGEATVYFSCLPWLGIATWGIVLGRWLLADRKHALRYASIVGVGLFALAIVLRLVGGFGNIAVVEDRGWYGLLSFVKYGPSTVFVCWNVGLTLMALPAVEWISARSQAILPPLLAYGRSALFFYLVHLVFFGMIAYLVGSERLDLVAALLIWLLGLAWLWPICNLYSRFKSTTTADSVWRLL
jgi:uncharacterized membrane protein